MLGVGSAHRGRFGVPGVCWAAKAGSPVLDSSSFGAHRSEDRTPGHRPQQAVPTVVTHSLMSSGRVADVTSLSSFIIGKWPKPQLLIAQVGSPRPAETSMI